MLTPIITLLIGALALWLMTRLARRIGLPEVVSIAVSLCLIAVAVALAPAAWTAALVSGNTGDKAFSFARIAGVAGLLFLSGARFNYSQFSKPSRLRLYIGVAAVFLFALAIAVPAIMGQQDHGAILITAAVVAGASVWLPGELSRSAKGDSAPFEMATRGAPLALMELAILVVHFYSILSAIGGRQATIWIYTIVVLYEAVKLIVFFAFVYFVATRFLDRAEGRISTGRMSIAYLLITILIFVLAVLTISQLVALAWAFVAGALWTRSDVGRRFGASSKLSVLCLLMSLAFLPVLLQTHGRNVTSWKVVALAVILAVAAKFATIWAAALVQGVGRAQAVRVSAAMLAPGEIAIAFLGFGVTRWAVDGPTYLGILAFTFLTLLLGPLVSMAKKIEEKKEVGAMKLNHQKFAGAMIVAIVLVLFGSVSALAQQPQTAGPRQEVKLGPGMSILAPGLMEIGAKTKLFLMIADKVSMTAAQRTKLEELYFEGQRYGVQRESDLDVADAELRRLLTRDTVDLDAVRAKIKEMAGIKSDTDMKRIEILLGAINALNHEQHTKIMLLASEPDESSKPRAQIYQ